VVSSKSEDKPRYLAGIRSSYLADTCEASPGFHPRTGTTTWVLPTQEYRSHQAHQWTAKSLHLVSSRSRRSTGLSIWLGQRLLQSCKDRNAGNR